MVAPRLMQGVKLFHSLKFEYNQSANQGSTPKFILLGRVWLRTALAVILAVPPALSQEPRSGLFQYQVTVAELQSSDPVVQTRAVEAFAVSLYHMKSVERKAFPHFKIFIRSAIETLGRYRPDESRFNDLSNTLVPILRDSEEMGALLYQELQSRDRVKRINAYSIISVMGRLADSLADDVLEANLRVDIDGIVQEFSQLEVKVITSTGLEKLKIEARIKEIENQLQETVASTKAIIGLAWRSKVIVGLYYDYLMTRSDQEFERALDRLPGLFTRDKKIGDRVAITWTSGTDLQRERLSQIFDSETTHIMPAAEDFLISEIQRRLEVPVASRNAGWTDETLRLFGFFKSRNRAKSVRGPSLQHQKRFIKTLAFALSQDDRKLVKGLLKLIAKDYSLSSMYNDRLTPTLITWLYDSQSSTMRLAAFEALVHLGKLKSGIDIVKDYLSWESDGRTLTLAVTYLDAIHKDEKLEIVPDLVQLLNHAESWVRASASTMLYVYDYQEPKTLARVTELISQSSSEQLAFFGPTAARMTNGLGVSAQALVDALLVLPFDQHVQKFLDALYQLPRVALSAAEAYIVRLDHADSITRSRAAQSLGRIQLNSPTINTKINGSWVTILNRHGIEMRKTALMRRYVVEPEPLVQEIILEVLEKSPQLSGWKKSFVKDSKVLKALNEEAAAKLAQIVFSDHADRLTQSIAQVFTGSEGASATSSSKPKPPSPASVAPPRSSFDPTQAVRVDRRAIRQFDAGILSEKACQATCDLFKKAKEWMNPQNLVPEFDSSQKSFATAITLLQMAYLVKAEPFCAGDQKISKEIIREFLPSPQDATAAASQKSTQTAISAQDYQIDLFAIIQKNFEEMIYDSNTKSMPWSSDFLYAKQFIVMMWDELASREKNPEVKIRIESESKKIKKAILADLDLKTLTDRLSGVGGSVINTYSYATYALSVGARSDDHYAYMFQIASNAKSPLHLPYSPLNGASADFAHEAAARNIPFYLYLMTHSKNKPEFMKSTSALVYSLRLFHYNLGLLAKKDFNPDRTHDYSQYKQAPYYFLATTPYATEALVKLIELPSAPKKLKEEAKTLVTHLFDAVMDHQDQPGAFRPMGGPAFRKSLYHSSQGYTNPLAGLSLLPLVQTSCAAQRI